MMLMHKYQAILITLTISIALHAALLVRDHLFYLPSSMPKPAQDTIIQLSFFKESRPVQKPAKKPPQPVVKEKKHVKPKAKQEPTVEQEQPVEPEPEAPTEQPAREQPALSPQADTTDQDMIAQQNNLRLIKRRQYMQQLLTHIERHKFYPRAARRRAIEGDIRLSFMLYSDGKFDQLETSGGQSILQRAAQQAVEDASPLPPPPHAMKLPTRIEISMVYALQE